jgi:tRNA G18 (ribose-2'-O)-methylase SpoU
MLLDDPLDPRVREYAHLRAATLRLRAEGPDGARDGVLIAEGELVIERALALGYRMRSLLLLEQRRQRFGRLAPEGVPVYAATNELMRSIAGFAVHRGVLASFDRKPLPSAAELVRDARRVVLLEDVNNHTNVGAIVRSASALGVDALLLDPNSCDPLYRRSLRISMGEALSLPHARTDPLPAGLAPLREAGFVLAALTPDAGAEDIAIVAAAAHDRLALLLGAEGAGLSAAVLDEADMRVRIPLAAGVDSLNVAAAAAIAFYALAR